MTTFLTSPNPTITMTTTDDIGVGVGVASTTTATKHAAIEEADRKILENLSPEFLAQQEQMMANIKSGNADANTTTHAARGGRGGGRTRMKKRRSRSLPIRKAVFS